MNNNYFSEQFIINKYLKKLHFNKFESYYFKNDGATLNIPKNKKVIVTNDAIIESLDFFKNDSPESVANKIVTYNLSDISSMGAVPYAYTLSLCLPKNKIGSWLDQFTKKLFQLQKKYNFFLIGGDLSKSKNIVISSNFFGFVSKGKILNRTGTKINDDIWVTGNLGESSIGLKIIKKQIKVNNIVKKYFIKKYLYPKHFSFGNKIVNYASSAIDISDGFYGDLNKLVSKKIGASINSKLIPFSNSSIRLIKNKMINVNDLLLSGDDYELVFTAHSKYRKRIIRLSMNNNTKITKVGKIINKNGIYIDNQRVNFINKSFEHFS